MPSEIPQSLQPVTAGNVDLTNCDREQVHMPGLIQPHGVMLVLRPADLAILQASENAETLLGVPASILLAGTLAELPGHGLAASLVAALSRAHDRLDTGPLQILPRIQASNGRPAMTVTAHRAGDVLIVEFEQVGKDSPWPLSPGAELAACIGRLQVAATLEDFLNLAVTAVRGFTGFDRVMAYQFADDGSGHVVAEARRDDLNPYLGQHFPASDIPAPARRLFGLGWIRHLPDASYTPVPLLPRTGEPVDMSRAVLRHVSVMYSGYLKNIRAHATMVMPLMKAGRLWGLISCMHHAGPLHVPCETRTATEILSHMVSSLVAQQTDRDSAAYRERIDNAIGILQQQMMQEQNHYRGLTSRAVTLQGWLDAAGAAVVTEHDVTLLGEAPTRVQVCSIAGFLRDHPDYPDVFVTDHLAGVYPQAREFLSSASGLLAARLPQDPPGFVMWFRPELRQTVEWAGDPHKPVQVDVVDGEARLTPRKSFEIWRETVHERSAPWLECEVRAAGVLRQAITEAALVRMNQRLQRSNAELDSFALVASHDLKEPIRGISNFATFLRLSADNRLNAEEQGRIDTILRLARRMDDLTDALLLYSRAGRVEFVLEPVDLNDLLERTLEALSPRIAASGVDIRVPERLPTVQTDRVWLAEVFDNLLSNAVKYNDRPSGERWVEVGWQTRNEQRVFYVRDNGIGIEQKHLEHIFQIFRRLHARDEYSGGNGAGLTIARRTIERIGGRLWAESDGPGKGSTFLFTLA